MPVGQTFSAPQSNRVRLVVASSVMLTFISFWRAAAVVLNDLGSSAFYAGGIAEEAVGKAAPWFILGVMLFSFAVRAVRRKLFDVHARRRLSCGERGAGRDLRKAERLGPDVRLHPHRTHLRRVHRPVHHPPSARINENR